MAYICENCGVVEEDSSKLCNPINEEYKHKVCSVPDAEVCNEKVSAMKYSCTCGSISADPQNLCKPSKIQ
jgi:hypothetical protein